ncbi:MAG: hypothetical protein PVJ38_02390 [Candidatus Bathyarchaeota archaeon]|jgi:hypothetical protein
MSFVDKVDALDLIIETLKDHEKALNDIVSRLDTLMSVKGARENTHVDGTPLDKWR